MEEEIEKQGKRGQEKRGVEGIRGQPPRYTASRGVRSKERYREWRKIKTQRQKIDRTILVKNTG